MRTLTTLMLAAAICAPAVADEAADHKAAVEIHNGNARSHRNEVEAYGSDANRYENDIASYKRDASQYGADVREHNSRVERYESAVLGHNREAASYDAEVTGYNQLAQEQRTQFQKNRLDRWKADLDSRASQLRNEKSAINTRKASLDSTKSYLDSRGRDLDSRRERLQARQDDLRRRAEEITAKKRELDDWAERIDGRAAKLNKQAVVANPPVNQGSAKRDEPPASSRPQLHGFNASITGTGEGKVEEGKTFPDAASASGKMIINDIESVWTATKVADVTSEANNLYRVQTWKFHSDFGDATATLRGSSTGASGDVEGWTLDGVKIIVGVQFSGGNVRFLTIRKGF